MAEIPAGERRRFHDDITIVCVDLENQFKKGKWMQGEYLGGLFVVKRNY